MERICWKVNLFKADAQKCFEEMGSCDITPQKVLDIARNDETEWHKDEKLICPKKGSPVLAKLNRFSGWSAEFKIEYLDSDGSFSLEQILNIINLAGFGGGIGSGRSSDYGRFHIENVVG